MAGEFVNRLSWHLPDSLPGWLLERGTAWLRWLPPDASRKATLAFLDLLAEGWLPSKGNYTSPFSSLAREAFWPQGLRVTVPGFGDLPHPVGLAAGWCRDGRYLRALDAMGVAFAEIGSLRLTGTLDSSQSRIIRDPAARALQVAESRGGISGRSTGTFRFPDIEIGQHSTDGLVEVDGLVRKIISRHISPVAISLDVPVALGEVRCVASVMGALSRISGPLGRSNGHSNPDRSIHVPVVLSFGAAVCYRQTDSILEALAAGGALLANPFLWIKIGPGWTRAEFQNVIETALNLGYQGLVVGSSRLVSWPERARLSGAPAFAASNQLLEWAWAVHKGAIPMIASGGVTTGEEAFQKILRGASAVEVLSALWLRGPFAARLVCAELHAELRRFGASSISDLTGVFYEDF